MQCLRVGNSNPPIEETIQDVEEEETGSIEKEIPKKKEKRARTEAQEKACIKAQAALKAKRERDKAEKEANRKPPAIPPRQGVHHKYLPS